MKQRNENRVRLENLTYPEICTRQFDHDSNLGQILGTDHFSDIAVKISNQGITKPRKPADRMTTHSLKKSIYQA